MMQPQIKLVKSFLAISLFAFTNDIAEAQLQVHAVNRTVDQFQAMPMGFVVKPACPAPRPSGPILQTELCANPVKYVCDSGYNTFVLRSRALQMTFNNLQDQSKIAQANGKNAETVLHDLLYTKSRTDATALLFRRAQTAVLGYLTKLQNRVSTSGNPDELSTLNQMIQTVTDAQIRFGPMHGEESTYNAHYESPPVNAVYIEAAILAVDQTPESLYGTILHELSHSIGPKGAYRKDSIYTGNPFQKNMNCLKDPNSVGAKSGDVSCFEALAKKNKDNASLTKYYSMYIDVLKKNNDTGYVESSNREPSGCQMGQLDEAFADWLASESYASENADTLQKLKTNISPDGRVDLKARFDADPALADFLADNCNHAFDLATAGVTREENVDAHPRMQDRLNNILLSNPAINAAIGCPKNNLATYHFDGTPTQVSFGAKLYCGRQE